MSFHTPFGEPLAISELPGGQREQIREVARGKALRHWVVWVSAIAIIAVLYFIPYDSLVGGWLERIFGRSPILRGTLDVFFFLFFFLIGAAIWWAVFNHCALPHYEEYLENRNRQKAAP